MISASDFILSPSPCRVLLCVSYLGGKYEKPIHIKTLGHLVCYIFQEWREAAHSVSELRCAGSLAKGPDLQTRLRLPELSQQQPVFLPDTKLSAAAQQTKGGLLSLWFAEKEVPKLLLVNCSRTSYCLKCLFCNDLWALKSIFILLLLLLKNWSQVKTWEINQIPISPLSSSLVVRSEVPGPSSSSSSSPGNLLEMQSLWHHPRATESKPLGSVPTLCAFPCLPGDFWCVFMFGNHSFNPDKYDMVKNGSILMLLSGFSPQSLPSCLWRTTRSMLDILEFVKIMGRVMEGSKKEVGQGFSISGLLTFYTG